MKKAILRKNIFINRKMKKLTLSEQDELIEKIKKESYKLFNKYQKYTHEELAEFEKKGIGGDICRCQAIICNTMTIECPMCGKILPRFAKNYLKRC